MATRTIRWWQSGFVGGVILSGITLIRLIRAIVRGAAGEAEWGEAAGFFAALFGIGFLCGVVVWVGRGLHRRIGMAGDAIVGAVVSVVFFGSCTLLFTPEILRAEFLWSGVRTLGFAALIGLICGAWFGRSIRRELSPPEEQEPPPPRRRWSEDDWV